MRGKREKEKIKNINQVRLVMNLKEEFSQNDQLEISSRNYLMQKKKR